MTRTPDELPYDLHRLPPSAELVYRVLLDLEPATSAEITESTCCPYSTVGEALRRLRDAGLVERRGNPEQLDSYLYETKT